MLNPDSPSNPLLNRVDRGEAGRVLKALRAKDYVFTVLDAEQPTDHYRRVRFAGNGFLRQFRPYPTMWVRLWFNDPDASGVGHQRAYTLVDPDVDSDTFWLEFALHDGAAANWAVSAVPGQQIEASLYGSEPSLPEREDVDAHLLFGDTASLPAINSLLDALSAPPAVVVLEWVHQDDKSLPVRLRPQDRIRWVERQDEGRSMLRAAQEELEVALSGDLTKQAVPQKDAPTAITRIFAWGACDTVTTRALTKMLRSAGLRREDVKTLGYWLPPGEGETLAS